MSPIIPSSGLHALLWSFLLIYRLYFVDVVQLLNCIWLFMTPWTCQAPLSFTISWNLLGFMSIELVTLSNHLFLCCPFLLLPSIFSSIRVFSNELALCIRWPKYWRFSISSSNEYSGDNFESWLRKIRWSFTIWPSPGYKFQNSKHIQPITPGSKLTVLNCS